MKNFKVLITVIGTILGIALLGTLIVQVGSYRNYKTFVDEFSQKENASEENVEETREAYNGTGIPEVIPQEVLDKYLELLLPADDIYDFQYASDYQYYDLIMLKKAYDSSGYEQLFGYSDATLEEIREVLQSNPNISVIYKEFIYEYACDLRALYPEVNLAVLKHNLKTLIIDEVTQEIIDRETMSSDSAACYIRKENRICVLQDLNLSKESDDYIILVHELCHAARSISESDVKGMKVIAGFFEYYRMGTYAEEGIITNIAYELQGLGKKATFYPMLASYYRIICDCIDYTGEDFFNHSVNYLIEKMDAYMEEQQYAYQIIAMIDAQMSLRYTPYQEVDFHEFLPMYEYIAEMYFTKYLQEGMSKEEAEKVFDAFYQEITFNFENMTRKYDINEETFRNVWKKCLERV